MPIESRADAIDLNQITTGRAYHPSPNAWEDEVLYFLLLDRFSDGRERDVIANDGSPAPNGPSATTPRFAAQDAGNIGANEGQWRQAATRWCGGTLAGLTNKIGYLKRLGVTAIWVSPVFKQVAFQETYHGYGIQNFLDVDPHFGTRDDLRAMVDTAHAHGLKVILDIILNHSGNVFTYDADRYPAKRDDGTPFFDARWDGQPYKVKGFNDRNGKPSIPFAPLPAAQANPDDEAVWPREFQEASAFTCRGHITNWDYDPEFREGDFSDLRDIHHGVGEPDTYQPSPTLLALCQCYKFWIAFADLDGFRIDTVKHMDIGATRYFAAEMHEFAQTLGKDRFFLVGEITGGRERAYDTLGKTGLDAALGLDDIPGKLTYMLKGRSNPADYFDLFRNSLLVGEGSHTWFRDKVVTQLDDHDQVWRGDDKARFAAGGAAPSLILAALALNAVTLGIPCIFYGDEQAFDGAENARGSDRALRECMFGGAYGSFRSTGRHFFREDTWLFGEIGKVLEIRREQIALRRGRQYLREISGNKRDFGLPAMVNGVIASVVAWSRILDRTEILAAINTDQTQPLTVWVVLDRALHTPGATLQCLYASDGAGAPITVEDLADGKRVVPLTVPAAGFALYR